MISLGACCILKGNTGAVALGNRECGKGRVTGMSGGSRNYIQNILYVRRINIYIFFKKKVMTSKVSKRVVNSKSLQVERKEKIMQLYFNFKRKNT